MTNLEMFQLDLKSIKQNSLESKRILGKRAEAEAVEFGCCKVNSKIQCADSTIL